MNARAAIASTVEWRQAVDRVVAEVAPEGMEINLALLFASSEYSDHFPELLQEARRKMNAQLLVGCSGQGVIGLDREIERRPALSALAFSLPGARLNAMRVSQTDVEECTGPQHWHRLTGLEESDVNGWLVFADPFTLDAEALINGLAGAYPDATLAGGLASGDFNSRRTHVFLNEAPYDTGGVLLAIGGDYTLKTLVSQGATPIGQTWTITDADRNIIRSIAGRPAYEVLVETVSYLSPEMQERVRGNLLVGLAIDEYKDEFRRGDFLIRNLMGYDPDSGALAVGALVRAGQTVQFQLRDAAAADDDLSHLLSELKRDLAGERPVGGLLCSCNGRGVGMFGVPDHDARAIAEALNGLPVAGFFCNGEIGPVGSRPFLHGFTASLALIVPRR
jgi:small ligand-binding sensory domain FIST